MTTIRIVGLLNFYDERIDDIVLYVASLKQATVDHLVVVDGAYALYPDGLAVSPVEQRGTLVTACEHAGIGLTLHTQPTVWHGNEPEKRTILFALGRAVTTDADWLFVLDTDEIVKSVPPDFRDRLAGTDRDCAQVLIRDVEAIRADRPNWPKEFQQRRLFRSQPIHVGRAHYEYLRADGTTIGLDPQPDEALVIDDIEILHAPRRTQERQARKAAYYQERDAQAVEFGACRCGQPATEHTEVGWRWSEGGPVAEIRQVCARCAKRARRKARKDLQLMGVNPDSVAVAHRYGQIPGERAA